MLKIKRYFGFFPVDTVKECATIEEARKLKRECERKYHGIADVSFHIIDTGNDGDEEIFME